MIVVESKCVPESGPCRYPAEHDSISCYQKYLDLSDADEGIETYEEWQRRVCPGHPGPYLVSALRFCDGQCQV